MVGLRRMAAESVMPAVLDVPARAGCADQADGELSKNDNPRTCGSPRPVVTRRSRGA